MSSFALKGLLTGAATALSAKMESEKEKTNKLLANRVSLAYENSRKYNDTVEALRQDSIERDNILMSYNDPDNPFTEPERIVAMQMPTLIQTWSNLRERGHNVSLKEMIRVGPKAINMTVDGYLKQLGAVREQDQTGPSVITPSTSFVSPSEERQRKMLSELSSQVNMTPEDVQRFQTMPRMATRESYGGFTKETIDKLRNIPSLSQQLQDAVGRVGELTLEYGKDSDEVKEASITVEKLKGVKDKFTDPKEQSWTARLDSLNLKLLGERDPAKRASLQTQIKEWVSINELSQKTDNPIVKPLTYNQYYSQWSKAANTYFASNYGSDFLKKNILQTPDGKYDWVGDDPKIKERTQKEMKMIALSSLRQYITNGKPINLELQNFLENIVGVQFLTPQQVEEYRRAYNSEKGTNISTEEATQQLVDSGRMISITGR